MITRLALFVGTVTPGRYKAMRVFVETQLAPLWRQFDGAAAVRVLWSLDENNDGRSIPLALQVDYRCQTDLDKAMASTARHQSRDMLQKFYDDYWDEVTLEHVSFQVT